MNWHERYLQQAAWTRELRSYLFEKTRLCNAHRVLEVGCGTGAILSELAISADSGPAKARSSGCKAHGLDLAAASLAECRQHAPASLLTRGNALALPYTAGAFDITYCHFLLLWVPEPLQALNEMKRVTASGGSILALAEPDYGARSDEPAELSWLGQRQNEALRRQGAALRRGFELADLFHRAGLRIVETGVIRAPVRPTSDLAQWESEWRVLEHDLSGSVEPAKMVAIKQQDRQALSRGEHLLNVPTYFAWGQV